jgi:hypothetical protein
MARLHIHTAPIPICELSARLRLREAGLRLERDRSRYRIIRGCQVLLDHNERGEPLTLQEVQAFLTKSLIR